jgi:hypothetical protein
MVVASVAILAAIAGGVLVHGWLHPSHERVHFVGGDRGQRIVVGKFIDAIRDRDQEALLRLDRDGAKEREAAQLLIATYSDKFNQVVTVKYREPDISDTDIPTCLTTSGAALKLQVFADAANGSNRWTIPLVGYEKGDFPECR